MPRSSAFQRTAMRTALGIASFRNSNRFALSATDSSVIPVTLPPGRARLSIKPRPTASPTRAITIGIDEVACLAEGQRLGPVRWARPAGQEPDAPHLPRLLPLGGERRGEENRARASEERATVHHWVLSQAFCGCGLCGERGNQIGSM